MRIRDLTVARSNSASSEDGSTLLLTIFYGFLSLVLILVIVAATSLYLERKRLFTLADGAAFAGAEAFDFGAVDPGTTEAQRALTGADVQKAVTDYLALPHEKFEGLTMTQAYSTDSHSATVSLSAWWRPPVLTLVIPRGVPITVTSVARSVVW
ncbi:pilus assembly protein TadG-related protein [Cryobacterium sp. CG_9.6]|uniref:pilus assembly protein TadG-related protein n=1 Tax=Cryobacterium sp. CG_9.6 TaxID=2760710 RepID=UPI0024753501|nr:pilus assembly protein TadG-related protein [Cryobacterium sp. CG_9.6]MDH6236247.1 putative membrane protein [Cryobacterium sp. CG_9.6]